jgi:hypothetical protein
MLAKMAHNLALAPALQCCSQSVVFFSSAEALQPYGPGCHCFILLVGEKRKRLSKPLVHIIANLAWQAARMRRGFHAREFRHQNAP